MGGVGCLLHGAPLVTYALDVCVRLTAQNLFQIEMAVKDLHPRHRLTVDKLPLELTDELCSRLNNLYLQTDLGRLDCLGEIAGIGDYDKVVARSSAIALAFGECRVLDVGALIDAKLAVGREKDIAAVRVLRAIKDKPGIQSGGEN
ncbi:MAG TPA: hypothetical protein VGO67_08685 [Verrucomicrobiae bacterium]